MLAAIATLEVQAGKEMECEKFMLGLATEVRKYETGNHLYTLCKDADGRYSVLELDEDEAAVAAHGQSDHFKAAGARFAGLMAGRLELQRLEVIG